MALGIRLSADMTMHEREIYSLLEWLGDVGGLYDGLRIVGSIII